MFSYSDYVDSAGYLKKRLGEGFDGAVILGSGLGGFVREFPQSLCIPYEEIPHFPKGANPSHAYEMHRVQVEGKNILLLAGRYHYYEGMSMAEAAYPTRVLHLLGVKRLVITNAAGGIDESFEPGDLMLITDHLKFFTDSPARGEPIPQLGPRFFDMTHAYTPAFQCLARQAAEEAGVKLREGVYGFMPGPQFETPAEIRALGMLGCSAVGMSTVPEVIAAAQCGMEALGISCITNLAAGISKGPITDEEVVETAARRAGDFSRLLRGIIKRL